MILVWHKGLTLERWSRFSLCEQLANVGMDIDRTIRWKQKNDPEQSRLAFERALELLTLTILDPKNRGPRRRELTRARELLIDHFVYNDLYYKSTDEEWQKYFFAFNYAAALQKGK